MNNQSIQWLIIAIASLAFTEGHEKSEDEYWDDEQFWQDKSFKFTHTLEEQIKEMIPAGGKCHPERHHEAMILHHAVRHGLTVMTKRQFVKVLHEMCAMIPEFGFNGFYQLLRCEINTCTCPFHFLTWSTHEKRCKIREDRQCGDFEVVTTVVNLNKIFGCVQNTTCVQAPDPSTDKPTTTQFEPDPDEFIHEDLISTTLRPVKMVIAKCECIPGQTCSNNGREDPPLFKDLLPWESTSVKCLQSQLLAIFMLTLIWLM